MAELQTNFDECRVVLARHIKELTDARPVAQSTGGYLLKYLRRIHRKVVVSTSPRECENTIRALIRFYLDAIDEGSALEAVCMDVLQFHRRSLRNERTS